MSGKLIKNALVMYDHQTETLWSQFLSRGVKGPLVNAPLEIVPAVQSTWQGWLRLHPDTIVLDKRGRYVGDSYEGYYANGSAGIIGEANKDERLPRKDLVLGVTVSGLAKAYPFGTISGQKVINDHFSGQDVVVAFDPASESGAVFDRRLDGRILHFEPDSGQLFSNPPADGTSSSVIGQRGVALMRDQETGSLWQVLTGRAVNGPLTGASLERLPSHYSFWFAWTDFHPETELFGG